MQEMQGMLVPSLGQEDPLEEEMATHSSILACKIPWTEEPGGLRSKESDMTDRLSILSNITIWLPLTELHNVKVLFRFSAIFQGGSVVLHFKEEENTPPEYQ